MEQREDISERSAPIQACDICKVKVLLPTGEEASFQADKTSSVRDLKMLVEVNSGVPSDLFTLAYNARDLQEDTKVAELDVKANAELIALDLNIPLWWQKFVDRCMKRDKRQILKRIWIKMNQISSEDRAFIASFIAAQKGDADLFQCLMNGEVNIDTEKSVKCSGRTLLHAAVMGGNFSCAVVLFINKGWTLLKKPDRHGLTPLEMAKVMNKQGFSELLSKYIELNSREVPEEPIAHGKFSDIIGSESIDGRASADKNKENGPATGEEDKRKAINISPKIELIEPSKECKYRNEENLVKSQLEEKVKPNRRSNEDSSQRTLNRDSSLKLKLHRPLRHCRSLGGENTPTSPPSKPICVEQIIPLSGNACAKPGVRPSEGKLPKVSTPVSTPTSSPMNSPRMGRRLVPSLLNKEINGLTNNRPGSPILRPRSPSLPRPKSPCLSHMTPPSSPVTRRRVFSFSAATETNNQRTRAVTMRDAETGQNRQMSHQMHDFLMTHYNSRETRPWNAWKVVKKNHSDKLEVSDDNDSSDDENERLERYLQKSTRRKTFEMWLTDKEAEMVNKQTLLAEKAKKEAASKEMEAVQRQKTGKTFEEWIQEKSDYKSDNINDEKTTDNEQTEARKAEALRRYQEWLRAKDDEAMEREDQLRKAATLKHSETQHKREEKMKFAWFTRKTASASSAS